MQGILGVHFAKQKILWEASYLKQMKQKAVAFYIKNQHIINIVDSRNII